MQCIPPHVEVATSLPTQSTQSSKLLALAVLVALCGVTVGCGSTSHVAPQDTSKIVVSVPVTAATVGVKYNAVPSVSGGIAPYTFALENGSLPPGVLLNSHTGSIMGVPSVVGEYYFILTVTDSTGFDRGTGSARIVVAAAKQHPGITISPSNSMVVSKGIQQFSAIITGTSNTAVSWSASAGTISGRGMFTAPQVSSTTSVTITATSTTDGTLRAAATVSVTPPAPSLAITTSALTEANAGRPYSTSLSANGGTSPYQWSLANGSLPSGIQLYATGVLSGTPPLSGSYLFTAKVTDSAGNSSTHAFTLSVSSASASGFDGPAELPRVYIQTAMANTPASGTTITVNSGGNLQSALNSASCGETIELQAGATFVGPFTFPAKSCDDNHWIVVRTSADDSVLPAEGSRLTPCYAGVSSLPGRPALHCVSTENVLAKLVMATPGSGPVVFASGANHYRLMGLEITRAATSGLVYALASAVSSGTVNNVILDRMWMHGTAQDDTNRGVWLGGGTYISVVDSFFTDFHCVSLTGGCGDSQAISGGIGDGPMGPYKITNNFLEAAGENILFGGGAASSSPTDIQVSQNHMFKPLTWMKGQPGYVGGANGNPFTVKNLFELKNAQRVLLEGNIMENSWGGFSQVGFGILLTPKNQGTSIGTNLCPICLVTDVTIRYNSISHVGGGLQIANAMAGVGAALDGQRYSIHDIIIDDINGAKYAGPGEFAQVSVSAGAPLLQNVHINHITAFPSSMLFVIGAMGTPMKNVVFANSIVNSGANPIWSTGGGPTNCAFHDVPLTTFTACFSNSVFAPNAIIGASSTYPSAKWPSSNYFPASATNVMFVNYNGGIGGDYHLQVSSPYKNKGSDGKDLGADIDAVSSAIGTAE